MADTDIRHVLPAVQAPTLVQDVADGSGFMPAEEGPFIAEHIPGAHFATMPDRAWWLRPDGFEPFDRFLASLRAEEEEFDRVLATVLFTDIVGSTTKARSSATPVARAARATSRDRSSLARSLSRDGVVTTGDGFFATFDGPARAMRWRSRSRGRSAARDRDPAGLHTGEVAISGGNADGIAVNIGARVAALADPGACSRPQTVKDLVAGSGLSFEDAGEHDLKGVSGRWHLYRVTP